MEEKRNIKVTLSQAIEWYNSNDTTLRTLALSVYTEDELKFDLCYIRSKVHNVCACVNIPVDEAEKYNTLTNLAIIAKHFNGTWKKTMNNSGYVLGRIDPNIFDSYKGISIYKCDILHAGTVYFKDKKDAIKAINILGERVKYLFGEQ